MGAFSTSIVAALVSFLVAGLTVFLSDYFGLKRDRARLHMEFDWQLRRQRWDALSKALVTCPTYSTDQTELLNSIISLTKWCKTEVEPWMGSDHVSSLKTKRSDLEQWINETVSQVLADPEKRVRFPIEQINEFQELAVEEVTSALRRMRTRFSELSQASNL
jgi:hypothetical protein